MRKLLAALFLVLIIFSCSIHAAKYDIAYHIKSIYTSNGVRKVNVVEANLNSKEVCLDVTTPHDRLGGAESFWSRILRKRPSAAIDANYFRSGDDLEAYGMIGRKGNIIYSSGCSYAMIFDKYKNVSFSYTLIYPKGKIYYNNHLEGYWETELVNYKIQGSQKYREKFKRYSVLYTPLRGKRINIPVYGAAVVIKRDVVTNIVRTPNTVQIPHNGKVLWYGAAFYKNGFHYISRFKKGQILTSELASYSKLPEIFLSNIKDVISCGPRLLLNGKIMNIRKQIYRERKIVYGSSMRSAIGVTKKHHLIMVTVNNVTMYSLAQIMQKLGCKNAINLDGGSSSGMYYKGKMITTPRRKLSTVFMVYSYK